MAMEATGKIYRVFDTVQVSDRFTKREFVVEISDNPKYPQFVSFQITGDKTGQIDGYKEGDEIRVTFNLRGREWRSPAGETKYFNTLDVWKVDRVGAAKPANGSPSAVQAPVPNSPPVAEDDIPF